MDICREINNIQCDENQAKNLLIENLKKFNSKKKINDLISVTKIENFDALLYNLKSIIETERMEEVFFPEGEKPPFANFKHKEEELYPLETYLYIGEHYEITCFSCNNQKSNMNYKNYPIVVCHNCTYFNDQCELCLMNLDEYNRKTDFKCNLCNGIGKLKKYKRKTLEQDCIYDVWVKCKEKIIPLKQLLQSRGNVIIKESDNKKLKSIDHFPDDELCKVSAAFIQNHADKLKQKKAYRLVNQTHQLISIPVSCFIANFKHKKRSVKFYVIGNSLNTYIPNDKDQCLIL